MMDSILFWNAVALEANRVSHSDPDKREQNGPTLSSRALAIVHLAMYDAYAGIVGGAGFPRYLNPAPPPPVAPPVLSARDAVAGAAHTALSALFRTQREYFNAQLDAFDNSNPSFNFGRQVANALLAARRDDMDARDDGYRTSTNRGRHRVDPDNPGQGFHAPFYGAQTRGFAITTRHPLAAPPFSDGTAPRYLQALRDVRARGIRPDLTATLPDALLDNRRSPDDTVTGIFWGYDGANRLGTPPRLYNQIVRQVAIEKKNNEGQNARLFAFVNAAMGDAGVLAWQHKFCFDFWRPVLGIREHDETLGPAAPYPVSTSFNDGDPGWLPLGAPSTNSPGVKNFTPNFPAYPSGHATFGAAALHITRMFYGVGANDKNPDQLFKDLTLVSDEYNGGSRDNEGTVRPRHARRFPQGLWQMIVENAASRVMLGVHWIFDAFDFSEDEDGNVVPNLANDNVGGVGLGLRIARDIFAAGGGKAPKMTPAASAVPPIPPVTDAPMPAWPRQPASVLGCVGAPPALAAAAAEGDQAAIAGQAELQARGQGPAEEIPVQDAYPSGISER
jgi:membrane-associated phospholipid phosphatase